MTIALNDGYLLGRSTAEYERQRAQARVWEPATERVFDLVELGRGARCLDAGCGPGETMRIMAQRVGATGHVLGVDVDAELGGHALAGLRELGYRQCFFEAVDLESDDPIEGEPFDVVYARLLLFHVQDPVAVLRRLWDAVARGGHLVIHDYDVSGTGTLPAIPSLDEWRRVVFGTLDASGRDPQIGHRLPLLFEHAGLGAPDGTDVAGRMEALRTGGTMFESVFRSLLPAASSLGLTTDSEGEEWFYEFREDVTENPEHLVMWPLMIAAWKQKPLFPTA